MRYAIYFAPAPGLRLHHLGASWLGRDAFGQSPAPKKSPLGALIDDPARYGFHATIKAPFALKDGRSYSEFASAFDRFTKLRPAIAVGKIALRDMDGYLALVPELQSSAVDDLASACVEQFDGFRRPADEAELTRRRKAKLTPQQDLYLEKWGYPYVFEEFRFHMTLTRRLTPEERQSVMPQAQRHFAEVIGRELIVDQLCIFREVGPQHPFTVEHTGKLSLGRAA